MSSKRESFLVEPCSKDLNIRTYSGVWPIKCRQGSKTNKSDCQFWKKLTFDWIVNNPGQDLFGQRPQYGVASQRHG
jgi:hypothetical protein